MIKGAWTEIIKPVFELPTTMAERQGSVKGILKSNKDRSHKPKFQGDEAAVNRYVGPTILSLFFSWWCKHRLGFLGCHRECI